MTQLQQVETGPSEPGPSLVAQRVKNPPAMRETWVRFLGWEDPLEEGMATHSSILAWRVPMDRGAWRATTHGVAESDTTVQQSTVPSSELVSSSCPSGAPHSAWATSHHATLLSTRDPPGPDSWLHLPLNCLKMFHFPSYHSSLLPSPSSTTPTPLITSTVFFPHNSEKTMSLRKQIGTMRRLKALAPDICRLSSDRQTQRKFPRSRTTYVSSYLWWKAPPTPFHLEKETVTHSSILAWRIPRTEKPGGLQFLRSQRVGHD